MCEVTFPCDVLAVVNIVFALKLPIILFPHPEHLWWQSVVVVSKNSRLRFEDWPCHDVFSLDKTFQSRLSLSILLFRWEVAKYCCRVSLSVSGGLPEIHSAGSS